MRDYQITSPSLEGVLNHGSLLYEGINRPVELLRVLDGPSSKGLNKNNFLQKDIISDEEGKTLQTYFLDLYSVFMKKISLFAVSFDHSSDEHIKLQALLQEMIKIKKLIG